MLADIATATPVQIDTLLMELAKREFDKERKVAGALDTLHRAAGDKHQGRRHEWVMTDQDAITAAYELATRSTEGLLYSQVAPIRSARSGLDRLLEAREALARLEDEAAPLNAEYARRPWPRFWNVAGGHVHSDEHCPTLHRRGQRTALGWMPELSGLNMADAIEYFEVQGSGRSVVLCSVCMPDAPTHLHSRPVDESMCTGSGTSHYDSTADAASLRRYFGRGATCTDCGQWVSVTSTDNLRKHQRPAA